MTTNSVKPNYLMSLFSTIHAMKPKISMSLCDQGSPETPRRNVLDHRPPETQDPLTIELLKPKGQMSSICI